MFATIRQLWRSSFLSPDLRAFSHLLLAILIFALMPASAFSQESVSLVEELREIESKVKQVADRNTNACVAISDGVGAGSGVIVTESGYVLTAGHVMVGQGEYQILFADGRTARAVPLGKNLNVDAGLVKIIDPGPWPYVEIGESKSLDLGDWVVSIGHSGGFELGRKPPVRTGRVLGFNDYQIETDAVLIGGDSGGALFGLDGKLVGINSSIGDSIAENRHVMTEIIGQHYDRMKRGDQWGELPGLNDDRDGTKPPRMGVVIDKKSGLIKSVKPQSPASDAGIKSGDIAIEFDGTTLDDGNHLIRLVKQKITGDVVTMKIRRGDRILELEVRLK